MYLALYLYPVRPKQEVELAVVFDEVSRIAIGHGAIADASFSPADLSAKYGLCGLDELPGAEGARWWVGLMLYRSVAHFDEVMGSFDADPRVTALYERFVSLLDPAVCFRGEFELAAGGFESLR